MNVVIFDGEWADLLCLLTVFLVIENLDILSLCQFDQIPQLIMMYSLLKWPIREGRRCAALGGKSAILLVHSITRLSHTGALLHRRRKPSAKSGAAGRDTVLLYEHSVRLVNNDNPR